MWTGILWAAAVCAGLGFAGSVVLVLASRFLAVPQDERVGRLQEVLPGANCGACGYAGCADYAQAIAGGAPVNKCVPGGEAVAKDVYKRQAQKGPFLVQLRVNYTIKSNT